MKSNRRKIMFVLLVIVCMLFLTGCWGKREVEEIAPLIGAGFDLGQRPGTFLITEQFAMSPSKDMASGENIKGHTISVEASSAREAIEMISKLFYRVPFMGSLKVLVIGEDAAKAGFIDILDFGQRYGQFRRSMYLVIAKGTAQSLLNVKMNTVSLPSMYIKDNIEKGDSISTFPTVDLGKYLNVLGRKSTAPIMPVVKIAKSGDEGIQYEGVAGGEEIQLEGAGVFRGDRLIDLLTDQETKGYMWLENNVINRLINTVGVDDSKVSFSGQVLKSATKYKVSDIDGTIGLQYQIKTSIAVDEVMGLKTQISETEWAELMKGAEKSFAKVIQKECELSLQKERELHLDYLGIGRHIEEKNPAYWKTLKDQWEQKIVDFPVSVNVQVEIHNSGMSSGSATTN